MPLIAALLGGLISIASSIAGRILVGLGIGIVTYTGMSNGLGLIFNEMKSAMSGLPSDLLGVINYVGVGEFVSIIVSATGIRLVIDGLTGDNLKRWVTK